jgi:hypothetical protein
VSVVAAFLVDSKVTNSVTLAPVLVMTDIVEKSRVLISVLPEMVDAVTVSVYVAKVVSTTVVPYVAVSIVSGFVLIPSFVKSTIIVIQSRVLVSVYTELVETVIVSGRTAEVGSTFVVPDMVFSLEVEPSSETVFSVYVAREGIIVVVVSMA